MAQTYILMIQARILMIVGFGWMIAGLYLGYDPLMVAWRAAAAALVAMMATGALLRLALRSISVAVLANDHANADTENTTPTTSGARAQ